MLTVGCRVACWVGSRVVGSTWASTAVRFNFLSARSASLTSMPCATKGRAERVERSVGRVGWVRTKHASRWILRVV